MKSGWQPEQRDLAGLGLAGICRETSRVFLRIILPNSATFGCSFLSALLLNSALSSGLDEGTSFLGHLVGDRGVFSDLHILCRLLLLQILLLFTPVYVYVSCVASLYCTGGGLRRPLLHQRLPVVPLTRLFLTFNLVALPFFVIFSIAALEDEIILPLLGWASAAYAAVVGQLACVVSVLEDAVFFGAVRRSRELLAGKFWTVATFLLALDGCIIALLVAIPAVMADDALGLAAGTAMSVALALVLRFALLAQPVVYIVCKSHRQELVDMVHLHGSTRLAVDRDN